MHCEEVAQLAQLVGSSVGDPLGVCSLFKVFAVIKSYGLAHGQTSAMPLSCSTPFQVAQPEVVAEYWSVKLPASLGFGRTIYKHVTVFVL